MVRLAGDESRGRVDRHLRPGDGHLRAVGDRDRIGLGICIVDDADIPAADHDRLIEDRPQQRTGRIAVIVVGRGVHEHRRRSIGDDVATVVEFQDLGFREGVGPDRDIAHQAAYVLVPAIVSPELQRAIESQRGRVVVRAGRRPVHVALDFLVGSAGVDRAPDRDVNPVAVLRDRSGTETEPGPVTHAAGGQLVPRVACPGPHDGAVVVLEDLDPERPGEIGGNALRTRAETMPLHRPVDDAAFRIDGPRPTTPR